MTDAGVVADAISARAEAAPVATTLDGGENAAASSVFSGEHENGNGGMAPQHQTGYNGPSSNNEGDVRDGLRGVKTSAQHDNGKPVSASAAEENGEGKETGEITKDGNDDQDMEVEAQPKEDVMVDFTDEFGRVRTMLQR